MSNTVSTDTRVRVTWDIDGVSVTLPGEVVVPVEVMVDYKDGEAVEAITEWLSNSYGFCVNGWCFINEES